MEKHILIKFLDEIEKNPLIEIHKVNKEVFKLDTFLAEMQIETLKKKLKVEVDINSMIINNYQYSNLNLSWLAKSKEFIYGGFRFYDWMISLSRTSDFWKIDFSLGPSDNIPEELREFEKLNWIDKQEWRDDWRYGCFIREKGIFPPKIAFFDKNWFAPMDMSFDEYITAMVASCAVMGWQYFYIDYNQELPHLERAVIDMEKAVKYLPELFPNKDFSFHQNRLKELKKIKNF